MYLVSDEQRAISVMRRRAEHRDMVDSVDNISTVSMRVVYSGRLWCSRKPSEPNNACPSLLITDECSISRWHVTWMTSQWRHVLVHSQCVLARSPNNFKTRSKVLRVRGSIYKIRVNHGQTLPRTERPPETPASNRGNCPGGKCLGDMSGEEASRSRCGRRLLVGLYCCCCCCWKCWSSSLSSS